MPVAGATGALAAGVTDIGIGSDAWLGVFMFDNGSNLALSLSE